MLKKLELNDGLVINTNHVNMPPKYRNDVCIKMVDKIHDKFKEATGLKYIPADKEIRITNIEEIDTDDDSVQVKLTFELKDKGDE